MIFGAAALGSMRQERADEVLGVVLESGVNHIDTAASYGDSELRLAPFLTTHRERFFLATKTGDRDGAGARASLERSLTRLGVAYVDLIQLHNLVEEDEWAVAHGPGGAVETLVRARDEGLVRHIGVTGHGLRIARMHMRSLERFDFASVLAPLNFVLWQDEAYRRDLAALLEMCATRGVAVQTIKAIARRRWQDGEGPKFSWYKPLEEPAAIDRAVRWVLGFDGVFLNTSSDAHLLGATLDAASRAATPPPPDDEMRADVDAYGVQPLFDGGALERI